MSPSRRYRRRALPRRALPGRALPRRALPSFLLLAAGVTIAAVAAAVIAHGGTQNFRNAADSAAAPGGALTASYKAVTNWGTGYTGQYTITNGGTSAVSGWTLSFQLPAGTSLSSLWNGSHTVNGGQVTVTTDSWDSEHRSGQLPVTSAS